MRYFGEAPYTPLREFNTGQPIGWSTLGGECLPDDCKFVADFASPTGEFKDEEAWLARLVTRRPDGTVVWELLDRYHAPGSPWALHSAWDCFDFSGRRVVAVANPNGTLRLVLDVDRAAGRFVERPSNQFRCGEVYGDTATTGPRP
jgi:hypothetical protein